MSSQYHCVLRHVWLPSRCHGHGFTAAGVRSMMLTTVQQAVSTMAVFTARRVLFAWKAQAVALAAQRDAEAEQLCKLRIQEARKTEIASKFHKVWHLHSALRIWQAAAQECASARAAEAQAALQEAAIAARMEIAAQFHSNLQLHAAMDTWRHAASSLHQERQATQQAQVVQSRIDAVLARVRAGRRDAQYAQSPWAEHGANNNHDVAKHSCSAQVVSDLRPLPVVHGSSMQECPMDNFCHPSAHTREHDSECIQNTSATATEGGLETVEGLESGNRSSFRAHVEALAPTTNPTDTRCQSNAMPYLEVKAAAAVDSGEIRVLCSHLCKLISQCKIKAQNYPVPASWDIFSKAPHLNSELVCWNKTGHEAVHVCFEAESSTVSSHLHICYPRCAR